MPAITRLLISSGLAAFGLAWVAPGFATTKPIVTFQNPGAVCQLSIPTTDTQVRPKASGFRNESTTKNAFVICGNITPDYFSYHFGIGFTSMDGTSRSVTCTAVSGWPGSTPLGYSTKIASTTGDGVGVGLDWVPEDFSGFSGAGEIPYGYAPSITCVLPPQTAINMILNESQLDIGT